MLTSLRIVFDAAAYRLKQREGGNLFSSMTLAVALGLPTGSIAHRFGFGALLNIWVYLVNDCFDVDVDLAAPERDYPRTRYLADHRATAWITVVALFALLALVAALHGTDLLIVLAANAAIIIAYCWLLKRQPIADMIAMAGWGVSMALVGSPLDSRPGLWLAGLLGILCMITEAVQILRDLPSDRAAGVRTTGVLVGERGTVAIARVLIVAAAAYAAVLLHRYLGLALLLALLVPLGTAHARRCWDWLRAIFGASWLALLAGYFLTGSLHGWIPS